MSLRRVPSFSSRPGFPAGLRVLLLDCTPNRDACGAQLKQCSYEVTSCSSITEALSAISSAKSAAAPFDVLLGEASALTGKSSDCDKLREQLKDLPTIVMSENPKPEEVMLSIKLGVAEVLERPLCPLKLKNIWQHAVRRMLRTPSCPGSRRDLIQLDRAGSCRRISQELCSSQNGSTTATQATLLSPVVGSPDPTSASSAMGSLQDVVSKSQLYSLKQANTAAPAAANTSAVAEPVTPGATSPSESRRGSKDLDGECTRRGQKRKSKELSRITAADQLEGARRNAQSATAHVDQEHGNAREGNSSSSSQNGTLDLPAIATPLPLSCMDPASAGCNLPCFSPPPGCSSLQPWPMPAPPPGCLPPGMAWGVPLNPMAVAPGITPPIFPPNAPPPMMLPPPQAWPMFSQPTLPGMPIHPANPGMFSPLMSGLPLPAGNPFVPPGLPGQLPPLPMSMLMSACGGPGVGACGAGMCGMPAGLDHLGQLGLSPQGPCSPSPTDPSLATLSDKSAHDVLSLGLDDINFMGLQQGAHAPKMPRCESNALLPSLEDLIADNSADTDMELELEALSLGCLGPAAANHFKRNDSLDDLISQSVVAF